MRETSVELATCLAFSARGALHGALLAETGVMARVCFELDRLLVALHAHRLHRLLKEAAPGGRGGRRSRGRHRWKAIW